MSVEFFGEELEVEPVVRPLVAVSELCVYQCAKLGDEFALACRDAVQAPGRVYVVNCPSYTDEQGSCRVRRDNIGDTDGETLSIRSHERYVKIAQRIAGNTGEDPAKIEDELYGEELGRISDAIIAYGFRVVV